MSRDWYKDHPPAGPESDAEYLGWAQDNGLYVDAAGNVDYGPPGYGSPSNCSHIWHRDPDGWDEGLRCRECGITEAELEGRHG